jgi:hypothetical protein
MSQERPTADAREDLEATHLIFREARGEPVDIEESSAKSTHHAVIQIAGGRAAPIWLLAPEF